jgi:hypothetical protein
MADPMLGAGAPGLLDMIDNPSNAGGWAANNAAAGTGPLGLDPMFAGPGGSYNEAEYLNNVRLQNNFNEGLRLRLLHNEPVPQAQYGTWAQGDPAERAAWSNRNTANSSIFPGMEKYYDEHGQPRADDPRQVASDAGISVQQLAGGLMPRYGQRYGASTQGYDFPSDKGGFFRVDDLYKNFPSGVPRAAAAGSGGLSTNNWRLLGQGPGWIMRNGQMIDTQSGSVGWGYPRGAYPSGGISAEQTMPWYPLPLGGGSSMGVPNLLASGAAPSSAGWPGATNWPLGGGWPMG